MHALAAIAHPRGQRRSRHGFSGGDIVVDPLGHLLPTGRLPSFERADIPTETPANREIEIARIVGDGFQMHGAIVEHVAETRP